MSEEFENNVKYTFKNPTESYAVNMDPVKTYLKNMKFYLEKKHNISEKESTGLLKKIIKFKQPKNPIVTFNRKKENGDMERVEDTLRSYLQDTISNGELIVPSFTTYTHPSVKKSLHSEFLFINVRKRKEEKHKSFEYKQLGDKAKELYYTTMQKIRKIFNNAVSGAYGSKGSILYNPSGHYTLTSITRCVASIGNMSTESMVAGNKYFKDAEVTINYIVAVAKACNIERVKRVIHKYNIYIPTTDDIMDMILYSSRWYWENTEKENIIRDFIDTLSGEEKCSIMYTNDLWHFKKHNDQPMRDLLDSISKIEYEPVPNPLGVINSAPEGIMVLVHCICSDIIKGMKVNYKDMVGTKELDILAATTNRVMKGLDKYFLFFKAFYTTDILPTSIAYIRDMLRDSIVLSDTDSTCGSYDKWLEWYYGKPTFNSEAVGIANAIMTINTQVMDHHIKILAANMNIDKSMYETLKMKNEFYWSVFIATNVSKHYFAFTEIQEGNVLKESDLELKGVHLIASTIKVEIKKLIHKIMADLLEAIKGNKDIYLRDYLKETIKLEKIILDGIKRGDVSFFKRIPVKGAKSYKQGPTESPYQFHLLWEKIFADKYGSMGEPPYNFVKINLEINNKTEMRQFLETLDDEFKEKFNNLFESKKLNSYTTIRIPIDIVKKSGIPEEIVNYVSISGILEDSLYALYMVLETLGFYRKPDLYVYQMFPDILKEVEDEQTN